MVVWRPRCSGERACCSLVQSRHGEGLQRDSERHRLLVVEEERGQLGAGVEAVAAVRPFDCTDAVAQVAQALHVTADRALAHLEALGESVPRPVPTGLEERQEHEHP